MSSAASFPENLPRLARVALSVPIYFKVLGIGALVAAVFGGVLILNARGSLSHALYEMLRVNTLSEASSLSTDLERPTVTGDWYSVKRKLQMTLGMIPEIRYLIVRDRDGRIAAHSFDRAVPTDLERVFAESSWGATNVLTTSEGLVLDSALPILNGHGGSIQVGMSDRVVREELSTLTESLLKNVALCLSIGAVLALGLTHILTQPIHHLVDAAERIEVGDFGTRAPVLWNDETGRLAVAFNRMAESLESYRGEVKEKERARVFLLERIMQAQEEERKTISRELHDEFGQTLLTLLLMVQSCREDVKLAASMLPEAEKKLNQLLDDIHRLVQGMRPPLLDDYGLDVALSRFVEEVSSYSGLVLGYQYRCPPELGRLPARIELPLYRIAQEAVANVVRHAHARRASVVVLRQRDSVVLLVEDDGCGFDPTQAGPAGGSHMGIAGMKERAALLGGSCTVESIAGNSTTVRVTIPLTED